LSSSALYSADQWSQLSIQDFAQLYNSEAIIILDTLVPPRTVSCRGRSSDPWFDKGCQVEKRCVQQLEREACAAIPMGATVMQSFQVGQPVATPIVPYSVLKNNNESFWCTKVSNKRQIWHSVDVLMGRGRAPNTSILCADEIHQFVNEKLLEFGLLLTLLSHNRI